MTFDITHFIAVLRLITVLVLNIMHSVYLTYFFFLLNDRKIIITIFFVHLRDINR